MKINRSTLRAWLGIALTLTAVLSFVTTTLTAANKTGPKPAVETVGSIERLSPELDVLIPTNAIIEKLADGFSWTEGPIWLKGRLLFSDIPRNTIWQWREGEGISLFLEKSGYSGEKFEGREPGSNGLTKDSSDRLVLCQHGDRRIARLEKDGTFKSLADFYLMRRFNSPNDLVYKSNGDLYFTDPPYGLPKGDKDPNKELLFQGVYRLSKKGEVTLLTDKMTRPNGIAFSPDEKLLYVANSDSANPVIMAYPVKPDGTLAAGQVFFDTKEAAKAGRKGGPDGMKVDKHGNLFATGPGGVLIISAAGKHLGTLLTGEPTANCAWGDDGRSLYITANKFLLRVKTSTSGDRAGGFFKTVKK